MYVPIVRCYYYFKFRSQISRNFISSKKENLLFNQIFSLEKKKETLQTFTLFTFLAKSYCSNFLGISAPLLLQFQLFSFFFSFSHMEQITLKKNIKDRRVRIDNLQKYFFLSFLVCLVEEKSKQKINYILFFPLFLAQLESFHCHCISTVCPKCSVPKQNKSKT